MAPPPSYADLGKNARDLFNRGYNFGFLRLDTTTKSGSGLEFKTGSSHNVATGKLFGNVDLKYKIPEYGVTLTEKWNTDNTLGSEVTIEDQVAKGLKLSFDSTYAPHLGKRSGKIRGDYTQENFKLNTDISLDPAGPLVNFSAVAGYENWLFGYQGGYDSQKSKLTHGNIGFGRQVGDLAIHTYINDSNEFGGSVWQAVNDKLEMGASIGWTAGEEANRYAVAGKYQVDKDTLLRAKLSNASQVAVAMTHTLNPHLKMTISGLINLQSFYEGGHKFGVGLEYEPK